MECLVYRVSMRDPGDVSGISALIDGGTLAADEILAIFGKTEGNGCVNDFTRGYALSAVSAMLASRLGIAAGAVADRVAMVMSGGTEGGLSPHFLVFAARAGGAPRPGRKALAIGAAHTEKLPPEAIGRAPHGMAVAEAVRAAMERAAIADASDVHWVQVKCPLLTRERIAEAEASGHPAATTDTYASMGLSRGAAALGVALALGEIDRGALEDSVIGREDALWSARASSSAGIELMHNAIDLPAVFDVLRELNFAVTGQLEEAAALRIDAVLAKAEASRSGMIRGARHIMGDDSDIQGSRHARALVGGVLAAVIGRTDLFVSGGAEHQGPDGGGPIAVIARCP